MRILFLTQVLPYPLDAGPKIRACYTLRHLAQQHQVTLLSFVRPTDTPAQVEHLAQFCQAVHTVPMRRSQVRDALHLIESLITGQSFIIRRDRVPAMARRVDELLATGEFDMVHADQLWMAQYALRARTASRKPGSPIPRLVLDEHNACYLIARRLAAEERNPLKRALAMLESRKMARYEVETCRRFDRVVWVTEQDHQAVEQQASDGEPRVPRSAVIPICGDPTTTPMIGRKPGAQRVTFLGGLHYPPNAQGVLWFVRHVWPLILQQIPDAVLTVIGKNPPEGIQYPIPNTQQPNLEITGYLPDPTPYLADRCLHRAAAGRRGDAGQDRGRLDVGAAGGQHDHRRRGDRDPAGGEHPDCRHAGRIRPGCGAPVTGSGSGATDRPGRPAVGRTALRLADGLPGVG